MRQFIQKLDKYWWNQSINSQLYRLREYSAVLILIWAVYTGVNAIVPLKYDYIFLTVGLIGSLIHSSTWLFTMPKIMPFNVNTQKHILIFSLLIIIWIGLSVLITTTLWK